MKVVEMKRKRINVPELIRLLDNPKINEAIYHAIEQQKEIYQQEMDTSLNTLTEDDIDDESKIIPLKSPNHLYIEDKRLYTFIIDLLENEVYKETLLSEHFEFYKNEVCERGRITV